MKVGVLDCRPESATQEEHRGYYAAIHLAWFYLNPPDPRTGERSALIPLGADPKTLENCNAINAFFKDHEGEQFSPERSGFAGIGPKDQLVELALQDTAFDLLKGYWQAWYANRGHQLFSEFYQSVDKWFSSFTGYKDSEWKELVKQREQDEKDKAVAGLARPSEARDGEGSN